MKPIKYVGLLRGINVGGHNVKMERLRLLFSELGLENVGSYIQSGNMFFETDERNVQVLRKKIEEHLNKALGYEVPTILRTVDQLDSLLKADPFSGIKVTPEIRLAVTFLAEPTSEVIKTPYSTPDGGYVLIKMTKSELFVVWQLKEGKLGKFYGFLEKKINIDATTRFWHTTAKIQNAAQKHFKS